MMLSSPLSRLALAASLLLPAAPALAQTYTSADPVIRRIFDLGMDSSRVYPLAQALLDSIGPRLTGTPNYSRGTDWLVRTYTGWGISARAEPYGTWTGWTRGTAHVDLLTPRVRSLEGGLLAWSPGTGGRDVTGPVIVLPEVADSNAFAAWLPQAKGKFVLISFPQPTCRPDDQWQELAAPGSFARMDSARSATRRAWVLRQQRTGYSPGRGSGTLGRRIGEAGALGVIASNWDNNGWGTRRIFGDLGQNVPGIELSCEDYGLVFRLAENHQGPTVRLRADAQLQPDVPVANAIAEIRGAQRPDEYVVLSAHFDSWDGGSGTTDNGTGTVVMMEAMRILKQVYPNPKRTIMVGHWASEEQGLNGSHAFVEDHPEVVRGLQAVLNQDDGTGRITSISMTGFPRASGNLARWIAQVPSELTRGLRLDLPGMPSGGGTDVSSFVCAGAPGVDLNALSWGYDDFTWHSNRDTFDKIVWDDFRNNATLVAMLAYLASEDEEFLSREPRSLDRGTRPGTSPGGRAGGFGRGGGAPSWPTCRKAIRSAAGYAR